MQGIMLAFFYSKEFYLSSTGRNSTSVPLLLLLLIKVETFSFWASAAALLMGLLKGRAIICTIRDEPKNCEDAAPRKNTMLHAN